METPHGIYYPTQDEFIHGGHEAIRKLAESVDSPMLSMSVAGSGTVAIHPGWNRFTWATVTADNTNGRMTFSPDGITVAETGRYCIRGGLLVPPAPASRRGFGFFSAKVPAPTDERTNYTTTFGNSSEAQHLCLHVPMSLTAGDPLTAWLYATATYNVDAAKLYMTMIRVGNGPK